MLRHARREEQRLVDKLRRESPDFKKLEAVRTVIASYEIANADVAIVSEPTAAKETMASLSRSVSVHARIYGEMTKTRRLELAAIQYLQAKGDRAFASEIAKALKSKGVEIGGRDEAAEAAALASYLSDSPAFNNIRGKGYGLIEWGGKEEGLGVTTPSPSH